MTQLFYDVDGFIRWVQKVRDAGEIPFYLLFGSHGMKMFRRYISAHNSGNYAHPDVFVIFTSH